MAHAYGALGDVVLGHACPRRHHFRVGVKQKHSHIPIRTRDPNSMNTIPWRHVSAGLLAAFFLLGGYMNLFASPEIRADYVRWGYPAWFPSLTGVLEWTAALLLLPPRTRLLGSSLGSCIMAAASGTVILNAEYGHAIAPTIVLILTALNGWLSWKSNKAERSSFNQT